MEGKFSAQFLRFFIGWTVFKHGGQVWDCTLKMSWLRWGESKIFGRLKMCWIRRRNRRSFGRESNIEQPIVFPKTVLLSTNNVVKVEDWWEDRKSEQGQQVIFGIIIFLRIVHMIGDIFDLSWGCWKDCSIKYLKQLEPGLLYMISYFNRGKILPTKWGCLVFRKSVLLFAGVWHRSKCYWQIFQTRRIQGKEVGVNENKGFPGMFASLDCMHYEWKNHSVA